VAPGTSGLKEVVRRFGPSICDSTGALDRKKLGAIIFANADARHALEAIIHPFVREMTEKWFTSLDPARHPLAIADIPLLFEGGRDHDFDRIVVVACEPATQLRRLMTRDGISEDAARLRVTAQLPIEEKASRADYVIRTDGTLDDTDRQVRQVLDQLQSASAG
jgi:dephospho-CoA kinase